MQLADETLIGYVAFVICYSTSAFFPLKHNILMHSYVIVFKTILVQLVFLQFV